MRLLLYDAPVINQPYYFEQDGYIGSRTITSVELITTTNVLLPVNNVYPPVDGFNLLSVADISDVCVYFKDLSGNIFIEHQPINLFQVTAGKKIRTELRIDPASSYVIFKSFTPGTVFPAMFALNVTLSEK